MKEVFWIERSRRKPLLYQVFDLCEGEELFELQDTYVKIKHLYRTTPLGRQIRNKPTKRGTEINVSHSQRLVQLVQQFSEALFTLHSLGFIHNDLNKSNLMICTRSEKERLYIIDFGNAQLASFSDDSINGTPLYTHYKFKNSYLGDLYGFLWIVLELIEPNLVEHLETELYRLNPPRLRKKRLLDRQNYHVVYALAAEHQNYHDFYSFLTDFYLRHITPWMKALTAKKIRYVVSCNPKYRMTDDSGGKLEEKYTLPITMNAKYFHMNWTSSISRIELLLSSSSGGSIKRSAAGRGHHHRGLRGSRRPPRGPKRTAEKLLPKLVQILGYFSDIRSNSKLEGLNHSEVMRLFL